jgi:hypothetical protein
VSIFALELDGWDELSTWGYDEGLGCLYAQLTRNGGSDDNGPEIWITPPQFPVITSPAVLAKTIAEATKTPLAKVQAALNDAVTTQGAPESFLIP